MHLTLALAATLLYSINTADRALADLMLGFLRGQR